MEKKLQQPFHSISIYFPIVQKAFQIKISILATKCTHGKNCGQLCIITQIKQPLIAVQKLTN